MIYQLLYAFLRAFLPWFFSGSESTKVTNTVGLKDMDKKTLSGTNGLTAKDLPALAVLGALLLCGGCALGGSHIEHQYHLVEPGDVVECVSGKVKVRNPGTHDVGDHDAAGKVIMPKSVYRQLRAEWIRTHGEAVPDTKPPEK